MRSLKSQPNSLSKPDLATPPEVCYDRKCENCDAWVVLEGLQEISELAGECRLHPPQLIYDEDGDPLFLWPTVIAKGFCLDFRVKHQKE